MAACGSGTDVLFRSRGGERRAKCSGAAEGGFVSLIDWFTWRRDDETTYDLLQLTGEGACVPREAITGWTRQQCRDAEEWAAREHLSASDNDDVERVPIPAHVACWYTEARRAAVASAEDAFWSAPRSGEDS
jgi:hypothetical protein